MRDRDVTSRWLRCAAFRSDPLQCPGWCEVYETQLDCSSPGSIVCTRAACSATTSFEHLNAASCVSQVGCRLPLSGRRSFLWNRDPDGEQISDQHTEVHFAKAPYQVRRRNMAGQKEMGRPVDISQIHGCPRESTGRKKPETHRLRLRTNNNCTSGLISHPGLRQLLNFRFA